MKKTLKYKELVVKKHKNKAYVTVECKYVSKKKKRLRIKVSDDKYKSFDAIRHFKRKKCANCSMCGSCGI